MALNAERFTHLCLLSDRIKGIGHPCPAKFVSLKSYVFSDFESFRDDYRTLTWCLHVSFANLLVFVIVMLKPGACLISCSISNANLSTKGALKVSQRERSQASLSVSQTPARQGRVSGVCAAGRRVRQIQKVAQGHGHAVVLRLDLGADSSVLLCRSDGAGICGIAESQDHL